MYNDDTTNILDNKKTIIRGLIYSHDKHESITPTKKKNETNYFEKYNK